MKIRKFEIWKYHTFEKGQYEQIQKQDKHSKTNREQKESFKLKITLEKQMKHYMLQMQKDTAASTVKIHYCVM